jgi:deoxycytidylate deaminase
MAEPTHSDLVPLRQKPARSGPTSREVILGSESNELFFAVVGHVGSGTSKVAEELKKVLESHDPGPAFDVAILKAREELVEWDAARDQTLAGTTNGSMAYARILQDVGDDMREDNSDHAAVARALIRRIRETRANKTGQELNGSEPISPDQQPRAYILDSIRHPAEIDLLAHIYQDAFILLGVVCDEEVREDRLKNKKFRDVGADEVRKFMRRDAKDAPKYGQRVSDAFHLAHYFLDNTEDEKRDGNPNLDWKVAEQLSRLKKILTHDEVVRPEIAETAMYAAQGAQLRSACLSRQVGASVVDARGNLIALGTNEVPRAGGGVYGVDDDVDEHHVPYDKRCVYRSKKYCSNTKEQKRIMEKVLSDLITSGAIEQDKSAVVERVLAKSPIGSLLEFSRAVHAEMDAVLSLARRGLPTVATRVFVTTFPCHYCARHLVGAGVDEVQYIEAYPKSKALALHEDAIVTRSANWRSPSKGGHHVLFRPFVGVAPRLYPRIFTKVRDLKDAAGDYGISKPNWTEPVHLGHLSYTQLEGRLAGEES